MILPGLIDYWNEWRKARACERQAKAHYDKGRWAEAAAAYREAVALRPQRAVLYLNLGLALYKSGQKYPARDEWKRGLALAEERQPYLAEQFAILLRQFG